MFNYLKQLDMYNTILLNIYLTVYSVYNPLITYNLRLVLQLQFIGEVGASEFGDLAIDDLILDLNLGNCSGKE